MGRLLVALADVAEEVLFGCVVVVLVRGAGVVRSVSSGGCDYVDPLFVWVPAVRRD